jgi:hypothetical protein
MSDLAIDRVVNHRIAEIGWNQNSFRFGVFPIRKANLIQVKYEFRRDEWNPFLNQIDVTI